MSFLLHDIWISYYQMFFLLSDIWIWYWPRTEETAGLESDGGPDILLAGVVLHHDGQTLGVVPRVVHGAAALRVAGDGQGVGDVVGHELAPDGGQGGQVLVLVVALPQDGGGDAEGVRQGRTWHTRGPGGAHT